MNLQEANREIKKIDRGLFIEPLNIEDRQYLNIKHKDDRTGLVRNVFIVMDENNLPCGFDLSTIRRLNEDVNWDLVHKYPDPEKMSKELEAKHLEIKRKKALEEKGLITDFSKENKMLIRNAMNNIRRSLTPNDIKRLKQQEQRNWDNRKIQIYV